MTSDGLREMARRRLEEYDLRAPGQVVGCDPGLTTAEAYELQGEVARLREQRGEKVIGFKVGCTSGPIQKQLSMDGPIFGRLFDTESYHSGARLSYARFANLAVEGELAVRLSRDLDGGSAVSDEECLGAVESIFPVVELHHYVLHGAHPPGPELIASNGMHAGFVLAEREGRYSGPPDLVFNLSLRINEVLVDTAGGSGGIFGPLSSLRWLAGSLAGFGLRLVAGQVVLTGSPMKLFPVAPGSWIVVEAPPLGESCAEIGR